MTKLQYSITIDCLQGYMLHRKESNNPVDQSWFSITATDIDEYVMTGHYCNYTNRPISNSDQYTQPSPTLHSTNPNGKYIYHDIKYQSRLLDESHSKILYQTTCDKSNCIKVTGIYTSLFLNPLCGEIKQVISSKLCRNINLNQSETSTSILRISNTITKSSITKEKLTIDSQSVITLPTTLVSQSTTKTLLASEYQSCKIQTLPNYSIVM